MIRLIHFFLIFRKLPQTLQRLEELQPPFHSLFKPPLEIWPYERDRFRGFSVEPLKTLNSLIPKKSELFQFELQADQSCTCHHQSHLIAAYLVGFLSTGTCDHRWGSGIFQWSKQKAGMKWMSEALLSTQQLLCITNAGLEGLSGSIGIPLTSNNWGFRFPFEGCLQSHTRTCHLQFYLLNISWNRLWKHLNTLYWKAICL